MATHPMGNYELHYDGRVFHLDDYDLDWLNPHNPRSIEFKDTFGTIHAIAAGPGIPISVSQRVDGAPSQTTVYR